MKTQNGVQQSRSIKETIINGKKVEILTIKSGIITLLYAKMSHERTNAFQGPFNNMNEITNYYK